MSMTILEALELILEVEGAASPRDIADVSGFPYWKVLKVLDENSALLLKSQGPGKQLIVGTKLDFWEE